MFKRLGRALQQPLPSVKDSQNARVAFHRQYKSAAYPHIHLHEVGKNKVAASYLSAVPKKSASTIGWGPLNASKDLDLTPVSNFKVNGDFVEVLNETLRLHAHEDPILQAMAATQDNGHIHVADEKNPPPYGRIPYPEDIIGTIRIEHGKLIQGSFTPMKEAYRIVSANGLVRLSEYLEDRLVRRLREIENQS